MSPRLNQTRRSRGRAGILGVEAGTYLNLVSKVHPDRDSTNDFAKELNAAKAVLMGSECEGCLPAR
jgi:hypothetical protein